MMKNFINQLMDELEKKSTGGKEARFVVRSIQSKT